MITPLDSPQQVVEGFFSPVPSDSDTTSSGAGATTLHWTQVSWAFCFADGAIASASVYVTFWLHKGFQAPHSALTAVLVAPFLTVACLGSKGLYGRKAALKPTRWEAVTLGWLQSVAILVGIMEVWALTIGAQARFWPAGPDETGYGASLAVLFTLGLFGLVAIRAAWAMLRRLLPAATVVSERILVVGAGAPAVEMTAYLQRIRSSGREMVGLLGPESGPSVCAEPGAGKWDALADAVRKENVDTVIIAVPLEDRGRVKDLVEKASRLPVVVRLAVDYGVVAQPGGWGRAQEPLLLRVSEPAMRYAETLAKRVQDLLVATSALVLLAPVMLLIAVAIRLDSKGPILFRQPREGYGGGMFSVMKFRTMHAESSDFACERQTSRDDSRITRVGAFLRRHSLDELPQLLNVLAGDMSVVGPRPHAISTRAEGTLLHEAAEAYVARFRMKPGITGWAQINGFRGEIDSKVKLQRRLALDIEYIERWSLLLDFKIICLSALCLFHDADAF